MRSRFRKLGQFLGLIYSNDGSWRWGGILLAKDRDDLRQFNRVRRALSVIGIISVTVVVLLTHSGRWVWLVSVTYALCLTAARVTLARRRQRR